jgi:hypothetical protein
LFSSNERASRERRGNTPIKISWLLVLVSEPIKAISHAGGVAR